MFLSLNRLRMKNQINLNKDGILNLKISIIVLLLLIQKILNKLIKNIKRMKKIILSLDTSRKNIQTLYLIFKN